jgi:threonine aldolase
MRVVELRSDTMTQPTALMRQAIFEAEVGDEQFGEDPTTNRLQEIAAAKLGKEAALLLLSGTMGNLVATLTHTQPGDEVIVGAGSHLLDAESAGLARLGGLLARPLPVDHESFDPQALEALIKPHGGGTPNTGLIAIENTLNRAGGAAIPLQRLAAISAIARRHNVPIHLDGARLFNAAVALDVDVTQITAHVDSVQVCLSKGLCAPLGSLLAGSAAFIERADYFKHMIGGGMRQSGIIAAAGIVALEHMVERLPEDHANARRLAEGVLRMEGVTIDMKATQTNLVFINFSGRGLTGHQVRERLAQRGVRVFGGDSSIVRFVTHAGVSADDIDYTLEAMRGVL